MNDHLPVPAASNTFERIKRINHSGAEFWSVRELARVLEYTDFRNFVGVIAKAREACAKSGHTVSDHFVASNEMVSTELAANLFRATQTEKKLRRENVRNKNVASRIHAEVGRKVRRTIHELGGTMPENLPVAESIKKVESREKKRLKAEQKISEEQSRNLTLSLCVSAVQIISSRK